MPPKPHHRKRSPSRVEANAFAKAKGYVTGAIMGVRSNLVAVGFILVTLLGAVNYYNANHNSKQIDKVWEHSANWAHKSDVSNAVAAALTITNEPESGTKQDEGE